MARNSPAVALLVSATSGLLTAMTVIAQTPDDKRTSQQAQKALRFKEFGCTDCHLVTPGKLALTDVGAKLAHLHLGALMSRS